MPFAIEIEDVVWQSSMKGSRTLQLDDGKTEDHMVLRIDVPKMSIKGDVGTVDVDTDLLPSHVYLECLKIGIKHYLTGGKMSTLKGEKTDETRAAATKIAGDNLQALYDGKVRVSSGARSKISGAVKTEAMRRARLLVKAAIKANNEKIGHYSAKEITAAATIILEGDLGPQIIKESQEFIAAQEKSQTTATIDISFMKKDEAKVAADAKKAAEKEAAKNKPRASVADLAARSGGVEVTHRPQTGRR